MDMRFTESELKSFASPKSFDRGYELFKSGVIFDTYRQDNHLRGKCYGNTEPYYEMDIYFDDGGILDTECTCPFDWGGLCKHIVALGLTYIENPESFIVQKSVEELLAHTDKTTLVKLINKLIEKSPDLYSWFVSAIEETSFDTSPDMPENPNQSNVSQAVIRKRVGDIFNSLNGIRPSRAYWMMGDMVDRLRDVRDTAFEFLNAGDAEGALIILKTLYTETANSFGSFDDSDGILSGFIEDLTLPLVEVILTLEPGKEEQKRLINELEPAIEKLREYGFDAMEVVLAAIKRGWSDEVHDMDADYAINEMVLIEARLNVLHRQNRLQEFLRLCLEAGEYRRYILKQIDVGTFENAIEMARLFLTNADEVLEVSRALRDKGHLEDAIRLAENGLGLSGHKYSLAKWLGSIVETQGNIKQAVIAYRTAFASIPSLELYCTLKRLSGKDWPALKSALMQAMQSKSHENVLVDIYLYEEDWDKAIAICVSLGDWNYQTIEKVADKVLAIRPEWVINVSCRQAEGLIIKSQTKNYSIAAGWLAKMKMASISSGRKTEWTAYLEDLKHTYHRRPALLAELSKL